MYTDLQKRLKIKSLVNLIKSTLEENETLYKQALKTFRETNLTKERT